MKNITRSKFYLKIEKNNNLIFLESINICGSIQILKNIQKKLIEISEPKKDNKKNKKKKINKNENEKYFNFKQENEFDRLIIDENEIENYYDFDKFTISKIKNEEKKDNSKDFLDNLILSMLNPHFSLIKFKNNVKKLNKYGILFINNYVYSLVNKISNLDSNLNMKTIMNAYQLLISIGNEFHSYEFLKKFEKSLLIFLNIKKLSFLDSKMRHFGYFIDANYYKKFGCFEEYFENLFQFISKSNSIMNIVFEVIIIK